MRRLCKRSELDRVRGPFFCGYVAEGISASEPLSKEYVEQALRNYLLFTAMMAAAFSILEPRKAIAVAKAILWNLRNLKDTYIWRSKIQANRNAREAEVLKSMYPPLKTHSLQTQKRTHRFHRLPHSFNSCEPM